MANKNKSERTALGAAVARLIEQSQPIETRLFSDPFLTHFIPTSFSTLLKIKFIRDWICKTYDKETDGVFGELLCRTKYIDEKTRLISNTNVQQILILGSGLDTRPYRLKEINKINVFEVDRSSVQVFKKRKIKKHLGSLPENVVYVAIDFESQKLRDILKQSKFDFTKITFIIWEGVTQYITKDSVLETFNFISSLPSGSQLIFTYILESVINKESNIKGANELMKYFENNQSAWFFGIDPGQIQRFLHEYNLELLEDIGSSYYQKHYLCPLGRQLDTTDIERIAYAFIN